MGIAATSITMAVVLENQISGLTLIDVWKFEYINNFCWEVFETLNYQAFQNTVS